MGDHKFVYLPTDAGQTYTITIKGTASGTFTLTDATIADSAIIQTEVFDSIPVTTALSGEVRIDGGTTLVLDTDGDGVADTTVQPDSSQETNTVTEEPIAVPLNSSDASGDDVSNGHSQDIEPVRESAQTTQSTMPEENTVILALSGASGGGSGGGGAAAIILPSNTVAMALPEEQWTVPEVVQTDGTYPIPPRQTESVTNTSLPLSQSKGSGHAMDDLAGFVGGSKTPVSRLLIISAAIILIAAIVLGKMFRKR